MTADLTPLLHHIRRLASPAAPESDAALLRRFTRRRDESAFAELAARHGPMVLRVCRRVLGDAHAAEDAFQATFLVLARRAGGIRRPEALAGWLYGVALRLARKARLAGLRRPRPAPAGADDPHDPAPGPPAELVARELFDGLDEEVQRLPEAYRLPVILCCLEGLSQEEVARRLGWTPGSVKGRLERGRARLHARLVRRGLTLGAALAAVEASRGAALPALAAGALAASAAAPQVLALAGKAAAAFPWKVVAPLTLAVLLAGAGVGMMAARGTGGPPPRPQPAAPPAAPAKPNDAPQDAKEDPVAAEMKRLEGTWIPVAYQSGKERVEGAEFTKSDLAQEVLTIRDGKYQTKTKEGVDPLCDIRIDPTKSPKTMDYIVTEGELKGQVARVIYTLDGDRLRICSSFEGNGRPKDFTASGAYVLEYRRAADDKDEKPQSDKDLIQGTWDVVSFTEGGTEAPPEMARNIQMVFTADLLKWGPKDSKDPKDTIGIHYTLDPAKDPKGIDTSHEIDLGKPIVQLGVYSLEGDALKLCLSAAGKPRPTKLESDAAHGSVLFVLKRAGAGKLHGSAVPLQGGVGGPVIFSFDGKHVVGGDAKSLCIWRTASGKLAHTMNPPGGASRLVYYPNSRLLRISDNIIGPRFCPDTSWLAGVPTSPAPIVLRDAETGEVVRTLEGVEGARGDGDVMLWDVAEGKVLRPLEGSAGGPTAYVFSPDSKTVAGVTREGKAMLWDVATGKATRTLGGVQVQCVAFSPDGKRVAAGGRDAKGADASGDRPDGVVWVWGAADGKELLTVRPAHHAGVVTVAFSPDGKRLITAGNGLHRRRPTEVIPVSFDGEVKVWDAETGKQVLAFTTNVGNLDWALVSPDGKRILVNRGWDGKGEALWSLDEDE
ncbi:MAG TPA: sigma-70 family RNA polymerase sigma factor [Gemmataceae bacterium]|nr:sigma-70 family RNA polymerase sigma factor [Gemmataceae bacterium]